MHSNGRLTVDMLDPTAARNDGLVERLTLLINNVYATAEHGLWRDGTPRATASELTELITTGQIAVATRCGRIVGSVRIHDVATDTSEFGMLVADPEQRGIGVGRALVEFAERRSRDRGLRAIQLELLVPRTWRHPSKEFLRSWYARRGYRVVLTRSIDVYPHLAPLLATPCDLVVHEKPLQTDRAGTAPPDRAKNAARSAAAEAGSLENRRTDS